MPRDLVHSGSLTENSRVEQSIPDLPRSGPYAAAFKFRLRLRLPSCHARHNALLDTAIASREFAIDLQHKAAGHDDQCATDTRVGTRHNLGEIDRGSCYQGMKERLVMKFIHLNSPTYRPHKDSARDAFALDIEDSFLADALQCFTYLISRFHDRPIVLSSWCTVPFPLSRRCKRIIVTA
jgi:hypothetical protein